MKMSCYFSGNSTTKELRRKEKYQAAQAERAAALKNQKLATKAERIVTHG